MRILKRGPSGIDEKARQNDENYERLHVPGVAPQCPAKSAPGKWNEDVGHIAAFSEMVLWVSYKKMGTRLIPRFRVVRAHRYSDRSKASVSSEACVQPFVVDALPSGPAVAKLIGLKTKR